MTADGIVAGACLLPHGRALAAISWQFLAGLATGVVFLGVMVLAWLARRRRAAHLAKFAREFGCAFHGDSFRGRFMGRAIRGDARTSAAKTADAEDSVMDGARRGASGIVNALADLARGATARGRGVRIRVELTAPGLAEPDVAGAAAAARRELKDAAGGEADRSLYEVFRDGTELAIVLRGESARPETAKRLVEVAVEASTRAADTTGQRTLD